ncbi:hypothetical protein RCJ22_01125, partial [Vibrio sp. FNV 38]|nr:hypothetical protein [Vibrio sp. FNV 38]
FHRAAQLKVLTTSEYAVMIVPEWLDELLNGSLTKENSNFVGGCPVSVLTALSDMTDKDIYKMIWQLIADGRTLYDMVLAVTYRPNWFPNSAMQFEISLKGLNPDYEDELEGQRVYALVGVRGKLICVQTMV